MLDRLRLVIRYRELLRNLTLRDLKVRYRNSFLGFLWAWGNPILMTGVFFIVFKILLNQPIERFPLFILIGWLVWGFTTSSITDGIGSIVHNSNLVKKVWFPREVLPASAVLANAANFIFALPLLAFLIIFYHVEVEPQLLIYFPIIFVSQVALVMGLAFILSALNVFYRDTSVITTVLLTAWFFLTPVFYPVTFLANRVWNGIDLGRLMYIVNPMASIIESYRNILYGSIDGAPPGTPDFGFLLRTLVTALAILLLGYMVFLRFSNRLGEEL
jgi:ABC-type polysaccharide/polyol phosphate export permease